MTALLNNYIANRDRTCVTFSRKRDAQRVSRRLRNGNILSYVHDKELVVLLPTGWDDDMMRKVVLKHHRALQTGKGTE
jgi:hypothetical protein